MVQIVVANCAGAMTTAQPPWSLPREVSSPRAPTTTPAPMALVATTTTRHDTPRYATTYYDHANHM